MPCNVSVGIVPPRMFRVPYSLDQPSSVFIAGTWGQIEQKAAECLFVNIGAWKTCRGWALWCWMQYKEKLTPNPKPYTF
jgi:hypothetical protein